MVQRNSFGYACLSQDFYIKIFSCGGLLTIQSFRPFSSLWNTAPGSMVVCRKTWYKKGSLEFLYLDTQAAERRLRHCDWLSFYETTNPTSKVTHFFKTATPTSIKPHILIVLLYFKLPHLTL